MPFESDDGIFEASKEIICRDGLSGLSLRSLSSRLNISASGLVYRFSSRDGLIGGLMDRFAGDMASIWVDRLAVLPSSSSPADLPALSRAILLDQAMRHEAEIRALWECEIAGAGLASAQQAVSELRSHARSFWETCFTRMGMEAGLAPAWAGSMHTLERLLVVSGLSLEGRVWVDQAVARLYERLEGLSPSAPGDSVYRGMAEQGLEGFRDIEAEEGSTPSRIIVAACEQILSEGCAGLSHRSVAKRAGVSLSSTTHHFKTLNHILLAAFWRIYSDAVQKAEAAQIVDQSLSTEAFIDRVFPRLGGENCSGRSASDAMEDIILTASRKPGMQKIAIALFALMGGTSERILNWVNDTDTVFDRFDGHVFRLVLSGTKAASQLTGAGQIEEETKAFLRAFL